MFGLFKRKPSGLDGLLAELEADLVRLVPRAMPKLPVPGPAYGVFLHYDDFSISFDDLGLQVVVAADAARQRVTLLRGRDIASRFAWVPQIELGRYHGWVKSRSLDDPDFVRKLKAVYLLLVKDARDDIDPDTLLPPLRHAIWRACQRLNARDWRSELTPTDDFVVVPGDSHGAFTDEDIRGSLPPDKLAALEARGLLFHDPTDADRAAERRLVERIDAQLADRPVDHRIGFWVRHLADDKPNRLTKHGWTVAFALERLAGFGPAATGPLIDLVAALDRKPDRESTGPTLAAEIARAALATIGELRPAEADTERKLRELLAESVRRNQDQQPWSETPYRYAGVIERLFHGYPWAVCDTNSVLQDADKFLFTPLGNRPKD